MTNFEWIKAMDDGDLAVWLCSLFTAEDCLMKCPGYEYCHAGYKGLIGWLRAERKEDD